MKLIVGLGNIGPAYANTRHNVGFIVIDSILKALGLKIESNQMNGDVCVTNINGTKVMFVKPTTLMNLSGNCVGQIAKFYKIPASDILVIQDDLDISPGSYKVRIGGSSGGHNGIKDISNKLGTDKFVRFKIGIGHPANKQVVDYVLTKFSKQELDQLQTPINKAIEFIGLFIQEDVNVAISKLNNRKD